MTGDAPLDVAVFPSDTEADGGWIRAKNLRCAEILASSFGGRLLDHLDAGGDTAALAFPGDAVVRAFGSRHGLDRFVAVYGGVVDHPGHARKTLLHPLVPGATPPGDVHRSELAERCAGAVLPGYSAFGVTEVGDAVAAVQSDFGPRVRLKDGDGTNGVGQVVVGTVDEAITLVRGFRRLHRDGVVVEPDLFDPGVLTVTFADLGGSRRFAFSGVARTVRAAEPGGRIRDRYAGIDLTAVRGGPAELSLAQADDAARRAVRQAALVHAAYPSVGARVWKGTYDVLWGATTNGRQVFGVSDPSLRPTASTPAEVAAIKALSTGPAGPAEFDGAAVRARMRCSFDGSPAGAGPASGSKLIIDTSHVTITVTTS